MVSAVHGIDAVPPRKEDDPSLRTGQTAAAFWQQQLQIAQGKVANDKTAIQATRQQLDHLTSSFDGWTSAIRNPIAWNNQRMALETRLQQQQATLASDQALIGQDQKNATAADTQAGVDAQTVATYWDNQATQDGTQADQLATDATNLEKKYGVGPGEAARPFSYTPEQFRQEMINTDLVAIANDKSNVASLKVDLDRKKSDLAAAQQAFYTDRANPNVSVQTLQNDQYAIDTAQGNLDKAQQEYDKAVSDANRDISIRETHIQQLQGKKPTNEIQSA